jgi:hypothetical protein
MSPDTLAIVVALGVYITGLILYALFGAEVEALVRTWLGPETPGSHWPTAGRARRLADAGSGSDHEQTVPRVSPPGDRFAFVALGV